MRTVKAGPELIEIVKLCYAANQPVMLEGGHGIGKSEILEQAASLLSIGYICRDLSLMEPPDLVGMPSNDNGVTRYAPPAFLPREGKGLLIFEELNRCPPYMRGPCLQLLTARTLNDYSLPVGWLPCAAINPTGGDHDVQDLDPALLSRFVEVEVVADRTEWLTWAEQHGVAGQVLSYVGSDPKIFEDTNPRAWKAVSDLLHAAERVSPSREILEAAIAGKVGHERMIAFRRFRKESDKPPGGGELLADYPRWRKKVKAWDRNGRTDLLAAVNHNLKLHLQSEDGYRAVKEDAAQRKALDGLLADLPADFAADLRKFLEQHGREFPSPSETEKVMTADRAKIHQAEGAIQLAKDRMAAKYPFHVALMARMRVLAQEASLRTMAVEAEGEEVLLLHNPDFVLGITLAELVGVLLHEAHHVLFGHLDMKAKDYPNRAALTIAQEVTVNEPIREPLPGHPVLLRDYPMLPPGESTEERYRRLEKIIPRDKEILTLDDHEGWKDEQDGSEVIKEIIEEIIEEAVATVSPEQIPDSLRAALKAHGIGDVAGKEREALKRNRRGPLDWRRLLRRYVGQVLEVRPSYARPPRRFPELAGIVPGQGRRLSRPKIMAVIDTSGSVTAELLSQINGELSRLARNFQVLVVECDCEIQRVYPYEPLSEVWGGGGTDFRPPLEKEFLRQHRPDLIVYFTDGYGPGPEQAPATPLVWCIVPGGRVPARWGRKIHTESVRGTEI